MRGISATRLPAQNPTEANMSGSSRKKTTKKVAAAQKVAHAGRSTESAHAASARATPTNPIPALSMAPEFALQDDGGVLRRLSEFKGSPVVLYFYPADDTPGCTKEACNFRDDYSAYQVRGVTILGVSPDTVSSHAKFRSKYELPFALLADPDHTVCSSYGVWGEKTFMGRTFEGVRRTTFLLDAAGRIVRVFENVKPATHSAEILAALP